MTRHTFDVLTQPWIPAVWPDGRRDQLGILSCLDQAHEIRAIRDPSPLIEFGLYRLLVAFVLDFLILEKKRPEHPLDLQALTSAGRFDTLAMKRYAEQCGDVFDLFHPDRPFLQSKITGKAKSIAGLYPPTPSGTNAGHWTHQDETTVSVTADEAARLLTTISPFMTSGGAGLSPSINGAPAVYALPMGKNLFETIVINLPLRNQDGGDGCIAWRSTRIPGGERTQATTTEALTWRPRKVQLIPNLEDDGRVIVAAMRFDKGDSTRLEWIDSSLAYRYGNDGPKPIRLRANRPLWRDAGPLLLLQEYTSTSGKEKISYRRPDVVEHAFEVAPTDTPLTIQVYAMRTDLKMKVFEWAKSTWTIPSQLGQSTRLGHLVQHELDRAERVASSIRSCIQSLFPREGKGQDNALGSLAARCERAYWQCLEIHFQPLLNTFASLDSSAADDADITGAAAAPWRVAIRDTATEQFNLASKDMDTDGEALKRLVYARAKLHSTLRKVLA